MEYTVVLSSITVVLLGLGVVIFLVLKKKMIQENLKIEEEQTRLIGEAKAKAATLLKEAKLEAKSRLLEMKSDFDSETEETRFELKKEERRLSKKSEKLDNHEDQLSKREQNVQRKEVEIQKKLDSATKKENQYDIMLEEIKKELEKVSGLTLEEAKELLLKAMQEEARHEGAKLIKKITSEAKENADKEAKKIIATSIQRYAGDYVAERTVSVVHLPGDEMKGRIIGREGRNIRALEAATGIDLIIDDTPEAVILSGFNPVRREVARLSLEKLISDGRIHPARIEEVVQKTTQELEEEILREGENTLMQLGLHNMHPELVKHIGKMKYRSSYGQNLLQHSIEVAYLTGIMAAELGLDPVLAKRAGLLHDVGKTVDKSIEGPHALIGYDLTKKYKEHPIVVNAVGSHHEDIEMEHPIAALVQSADAISGARPGARREPLESYVKRLENLETLARSFEGVAKTYAIQAGREIRVVVENDKVDDVVADRLAREIAQKIEEEMEYPGQIKVTVIREVRKIAIAK